MNESATELEQTEEMVTDKVSDDHIAKVADRSYTWVGSPTMRTI